MVILLGLLVVWGTILNIPNAGGRRCNGFAGPCHGGGELSGVPSWLFRIPNFSKEYTQHAPQGGLVPFFHKLIQKKEGASLGVSSSTWERWWERERATSTPQPAAAHSPPPVPCTPQPANAAALCIAVSLFQINSSRVRDLHPDGEVAAIAGGASLGVLVLWPWEWPWGRPWRRPWERPRERRTPHARSIV